jgi:hypothetical protein
MLTHDSVRMEVLCVIFIEFSAPMNFGRLIQMCSNGIYNRVGVGNHLSDTFAVENGLRQEEAFSLFLLSFSVEYVLRRIQAQ